MPILNILEYPDPRLRNKAKPVEQFDDTLRTLVDNMFDTMYEAPGIGLAASQVNIHRRIIVIDISEKCDEPRVFINPTLSLGPGTLETDEGCLSVPGFYETVSRAENIVVNAFDQHGAPFELAAQGLLAVCIQHECDHLLGKMFVDYLSRMKQQRIRQKLAKLKRQRAQE
jgi:peptide deformylase